MNSKSSKKPLNTDKIETSNVNDMSLDKTYLRVENKYEGRCEKRPPYIVRLILENEKHETYRVDRDLFFEIKEKVESYRSLPAKSKMVRCIETGKLFKNAREANHWLREQGITDSIYAEVAIKDVCHGRKETACGYHWRFAGLLV